MEAGRELDMLVAEKVMGLKLAMGWRVSPGYGECDYASDHEVEGAQRELVVAADYSADGIIPDYSTSIAAAWQVVEKLTHDHFYSFNLHRATVDKDAWDAQFGVLDRVFAETGPLAICLAALKTRQGGKGTR